MMPDFVQHFYTSLSSAFIRFDEELLGGKNYIGRYWENDSVVFNRVKAGKGQQQQQPKQRQRQQRQESLLLRPPPTCISAYTAETESRNEEDNATTATT
eukprot:15122553-Ditylum_brightwellii.AAC.1